MFKSNGAVFFVFMFEFNPFTFLSLLPKLFLLYFRNKFFKIIITKVSQLIIIFYFDHKFFRFVLCFYKFYNFQKSYFPTSLPTTMKNRLIFNFMC